MALDRPWLGPLARHRCSVNKLKVKYMFSGPAFTLGRIDASRHHVSIAYHVVRFTTCFRFRCLHCIADCDVDALIPPSSRAQKNGRAAKIYHGPVNNEYISNRPGSGIDFVSRIPSSRMAPPAAAPRRPEGRVCFKTKQTEIGPGIPDGSVDMYIFRAHI